MPVQTLSDGTPLTYEWFNSIANAINSLEIAQKDNSNITVGGIEGETDWLVLPGKKQISVRVADKRNQIFRQNIKFDRPFRDDDVYVVAMVTNGIGAQPIAAGVAVSDVNSKGFDCVIQLFDDDEKFEKTKFELRFIAVGHRPAFL